MVNKKSLGNENSYNAIVIGAGLAGLSAAANLAKAGKKVVVLEQIARPGGCYTSFFRKNVVFDITAHWTVDHHKVNSLLTELNAPMIEFTPRLNIGEYIGPDKERGILLINNKAKFVKSIKENYPQASLESIECLVKLSLKVEEELRRSELMSPEISPIIVRAFGMIPLLFKMRTVLKYAKMPAEKLLLELFPSDDLKGLRMALYTIAPLRDISAIGFLALIGFALKGRAYEPVGGAYKTAEAFESAAIRNGVEIRYSTKVKRITFLGKRASGVILENGDILLANNVVAAISPMQTFKELIEPNIVPARYIEKLDSTPISDPYIIVSIVTDLNLPKVDHDAIDMFISSSYDLKTSLQLNEPEKALFSIQFTRYQIGKEDKNLKGIQLVAPASFDFENTWRTGPSIARSIEYNQLKDDFSKRLLNRAEHYIPGLKKHILSLNVATPVTMYRFTLNTAGAPVGWSYASRTQWKQRIPYVKGLYGAGHWYGPSGIYNVALSGKNAATLILRDSK